MLTTLAVVYKPVGREAHKCYCFESIACLACAIIGGFGPVFSFAGRNCGAAFVEVWFCYPLPLTRASHNTCYTMFWFFRESLLRVGIVSASFKHLPVLEYFLMLIIIHNDLLAHRKRLTA